MEDHCIRSTGKGVSQMERLLSNGALLESAALVLLVSKGVILAIAAGMFLALWLHRSKLRERIYPAYWAALTVSVSAEIASKLA